MAFDAGQFFNNIANKFTFGKVQNNENNTKEAEKNAPVNQQAAAQFKETPDEEISLDKKFQNNVKYGYPNMDFDGGTVNDTPDDVEEPQYYAVKYGIYKPSPEPEVQTYYGVQILKYAIYNPTPEPEVHTDYGVQIDPAPTSEPTVPILDYYGIILPEDQPTVAPKPTAGPAPIAEPTVAPTPEPTVPVQMHYGIIIDPEPTAEPSITPTAEPTVAPKPTAGPAPTAEPTVTPVRINPWQSTISKIIASLFGNTPAFFQSRVQSLLENIFSRFN